MKYLNNPALCCAIAAMCRDPNLRFVGDWSQGHPAKWRPYATSNPATGQPFTDDEAWEYIASLIEAFHALQIVDLETPIGTEAFVLKCGVSEKEIYMKITLSKSGKKIIGRSFHYS